MDPNQHEGGFPSWKLKIEEKKVRVFIVDDSAAVRSRLVALLDDLGAVEVIGQAEDADKALTGVQQLKPDVVILDIRLPKGSGLDVLRAIRKETAPPAVIMLTNFPYSPYRQRSLEAGASYFFDKSSEFDQIPRALEELSGRGGG